MTEDYLARVKWESDHPYRTGDQHVWRDEPKWKYKRVYGTQKSGAQSISWMKWWLLVIIATAAYIIVDLDSLQADFSIYIGLGILLFEVLILFIPSSSEKS